MRVTLAEDSTLLREGLARLLEDEGHEILDAVADADALVAAVAHRPPDVVVTDVRMPPNHSDDGLRAALRLRDEQPEVGVLVLSQYVETRFATELISTVTSGVGYLLKDRIAEVGEFLEALGRISDGGTAFDPEVVRRLLARTKHSSSPLERLTPRESAVLELMAQGLTNARIAAELYISVSSAEKNINAIFEKLGLANSTGMSRRVVAVVQYLSR